jgi:hypothetical protein
MLTLLLTALTLTQSPEPSTHTLETELRQIIAASGAEVAVAYRTLDGRTELLVDADKPFHAASTMKVPVMIELFRAGTRRHALAGRSAPHPQRFPQHRRRQSLHAQRGRRFGQGRLCGYRKDDDAGSIV